ncbi:hypothetical protein LOC68_07835 [Blastopirellula sp. JC732]|uniref:RHS repeat-associated core domain-containing protein n=1 Tax=Blastopirellula sediminis TaxID=2894196 RepID=A0A9X1SFX7_9BACT|nr:RHS repeat-associated core domain-containing protein [Blastopirellula sediminis]MCC9608921.1 hypothetical protein [Blastopirellula sediminis]MCC9628302.1 hypothetical protein [Blastopirellula sediminis]
MTNVEARMTKTGPGKIGPDPKRFFLQGWPTQSPRDWAGRAATRCRAIRQDPSVAFAQQTGVLTLTLSDGRTLTYDLLYNAPDAEITLTLDGSEVSTSDKLAFGLTGEGQSVNKSLVIANNSANTLYLADWDIPAGFSIANLAGLASIAPNSTATLAITLNAMIPGLNSGTLQFVTNDDNESAFSIALSGFVTSDGDGQSVVAGYTYSYDVGNRLTGSTVYGHSTEDAAYSYDATNQITAADRSGSANDESFTYDDNGNRIDGSKVIGDNNQILSDGTYTYGYDDEGNIVLRTNIADGSYAVYEWDYRNRLTSVTDYDVSDVKQQQVVYGYDAFNNLISRDFDSDGDGTFDVSGYFIYDNGQILLQLDSSGDVDHRMLWGPMVDQILADENGAGDVSWMLTDHQNTVRDVVQYDDVNDMATIVNHIAYNVVGEITSQTDDSLDTLPFHYTARYFDEATGLQYNTNRWYNAELSRWMSQDPIGFAAGDANLYRYVGNAHLNGVDPSGLYVFPGILDPDSPGAPPLPPLTPVEEMMLIANRPGGIYNDEKNYRDLVNFIAKHHIQTSSGSWGLDRTVFDAAVNELARQNKEARPNEWYWLIHCMTDMKLADHVTQETRRITGAPLVTPAEEARIAIANGSELGPDVAVVVLGRLGTNGGRCPSSSTSNRTPKNTPPSKKEMVPQKAQLQQAKARNAAKLPNGYWDSGKRVFPTKTNSGLSGNALAAEQKEFFKKGLAAGTDSGILRGQASEAGYERLGGTGRPGDRLTDPSAEKALQDAISEILGGK